MSNEPKQYQTQTTEPPVGEDAQRFYWVCEKCGARWVCADDDERSKPCSACGWEFPRQVEDFTFLTAEALAKRVEIILEHAVSDAHAVAGEWGDSAQDEDETRSILDEVIRRLRSC